MKQFHGKELENTDKNLIKGLFKRRPHKPYAEDLTQEEKFKNVDIETIGAAATNQTFKALVLPRTQTMSNGPRQGDTRIEEAGNMNSSKDTLLFSAEMKSEILVKSKTTVKKRGNN